MGENLILSEIKPETDKETPQEGQTGADFKKVMWGNHVHPHEAQIEQHLSARTSGKCRYLFSEIAELNSYILILSGHVTNRPVEEQLINTYVAEKIHEKSASSANLLIMLTIHQYPKFFFPLGIILFHILSKLINRCVNRLIHILIPVLIHCSQSKYART